MNFDRCLIDPKNDFNSSVFVGLSASCLVFIWFYPVLVDVISEQRQFIFEQLRLRLSIQLGIQPLVVWIGFLVIPVHCSPRWFRL